MRNRWLHFVLIGLLLSFSTASAGEYQGGTESPLRFGVGARELSLGGASIARCDASTAAFWNPARLAEAEYMTLSGFHTNLFDTDVAYQYAGLSIPTLDMGSFGFGVQRLGVDDIERRDSANFLEGSFSDTRLGFHAAYGRYWGSYQVGVSVGLEHHALDNYSATSSPEVNIAIMRSFVPSTSLLGEVDAVLYANNMFGSSVELDQESMTQPSALAAGLTTDLFPSMSNRHRTELSVRLTKVDEVDMAFAAGLEYTYGDMISLRGGLRDDEWSVGVGVGYEWFAFDYALVNRTLGSLHMLAFTTSFGTAVSERRLLKAEQREAEFQDRMQDQLHERNAATIAELVETGRAAFETNLTAEAVNSLDRAMFIARSSGLDTSQISPLLETASQRLEQEQREIEHQLYMDSAQYSLSVNELVNARYFCGQAAKADPGSTDAAVMIAQVNQMLDDNAAREALVTEQVQQIELSLTYGAYKDAIDRAVSLEEIAPDDNTVVQLLKRARFEDLRNRGDRAFAAGQYESALQLVDEAESIFPEHHWSSSLRDRVRQATVPLRSPVPTSSSLAEIVPTEASQKQAEELYRVGQLAFEHGDFEEAISTWERVELLVPDFLSVRNYLVEAYKYLGVEHYSNDQLEQALTVWRRAAELMPHNQEIASYIKRTESEISKIRKLSYEP